jgi:hypothetical protein
MYRFSILLAGEEIKSSNDGLADLVGRISLFMLALVVFVVLCGLAWRYLPFLRKIVPTPQQVAEMEREKAEREAAARPKRTINLAAAKPLAASPAVTGESLVDTEQPPDSSLAVKAVHPSGDTEVKGEGGAVHKDLEVALTEGQPGTVVRAASDLNGVNSASPIVIVNREE